MLVRIVKMAFEPECVVEFQSRFQSIKDQIIGFDGCELLELYQDKNDKTIFFTYSYWKSETALNEYRQSDFFKKVWGETKKMFAKKPEAWSVDKIVSLSELEHKIKKG